MSKKQEKNSAAVTSVNGTISYSGEVTIKLLKGKKVIKSEKIKNNCTVTLLKSLTMFLENIVDTNLLPKYMGLGTESSGWTINTLHLMKEVPNSRVPIVRHSIEELTSGETLIGYKAPFSATFPSNIIAGLEIKELGLFSGSYGNDNLLARISVDSIPKIDAGLSLVIEWVISIKNKD